MNKSARLFETLNKTKLIALLKPKSEEECISAYEICNPLGVTLEIALRSEFALAGMKAVIEKYPDALIMAGTVMSRSQAKDAIDAGVAGIVSADYIPSVVDECVNNDIMCIPGGIADAGKQLSQKAELYGCDFSELKEKYPYQWIYKLFPAFSGNIDNTSLSKTLKGPYKGLSLVYTGGVNSGNVDDIVHSDPDGIICASTLTKNIDDPDKMKADIEHWLSIINTKKTERTATPPVKPGHTAKVVTFGEIMLRLSPPPYQRIVQANSFDVNFGGAEANTAVAFANYGLSSTLVSALPKNEVGQAAVNSLRAHGVCTDRIIRQGNRTGIYFLEYGASQRPSKVIYDRAGAAITELKPGQIDWDAVFDGATWFHWSGITPALGNHLPEITKEALKAAKKAGATISVDLNYRKKLWSEDEARAVMEELMEYTDICIGNEEDAERIFSIKAIGADIESGELDENSYKDVAKQLSEKYNFDKVAITLRKSISASDNNWSACLYNGSEFMLSSSYDIHLVDRVGGGDSFSSGLIYGLITGMPDTEALEFGVAASCLKQTIPGDFNLVSVDEVKHIMSGKTGGRVQR